VGEYVDRMTDGQVFELKTRIAEREFQIEAKTDLDFKSVEAMIYEIQRLYK
jgi:hypothetical protein